MQTDPTTRFRLSNNNTVEATSRGRAISALAVLIVVSSAAAGVWEALNWSARNMTLDLPQEVVQQLDGDGRQLVERLQRDPCNRTTAVDLADALIKKDEFAAMVSFYHGRVSKCGANDDLFPSLYFAQMGTADYVGAKQTSESLVRNYPEDPDSFGWRSAAREKLGDIVGAYSDMREAMSRFVDPSDVALQTYYDTARLAAKAGHPCDAVLTIRDYVAYDAADRRTQQLDTLMREWQRAGSCSIAAGVGMAVVAYDRSAGGYVVSVSVNGVPARMLVDTGATITFLSASVARRAGVVPSGQFDRTLTTANGDIIVSNGRARSIAVGGSSLRDAAVLIQSDTGPSLGEGVDGLLGLSFLGNFQVKLNDGHLELRPTG